MASTISTPIPRRPEPALPGGVPIVLTLLVGRCAQAHCLT